MVGLRPDGAKGAAGGDGDRAEPSAQEEPRVRGPRREHTVCFGDRKRAMLEPSTERGGQTGPGHTGLQRGEVAFCLRWEPPGSFLSGAPRETDVAAVCGGTVGAGGGQGG